MNFRGNVRNVESFVLNPCPGQLFPVQRKSHGCQSVPRKIKGGGPQGATIELLEYLSQSNNCADIVNESERFRFLDDLSILEFVNLWTVGLS